MRHRYAHFVKQEHIRSLWAALLHQPAEIAVQGKLQKLLQPHHAVPVQKGNSPLKIGPLPVSTVSRASIPPRLEQARMSVKTAPQGPIQPYRLELLQVHVFPASRDLTLQSLEPRQYQHVSCVEKGDFHQTKGKVVNSLASRATLEPIRWPLAQLTARPAPKASLPQRSGCWHAWRASRAHTPM